MVSGAAGITLSGLQHRRKSRAPLPADLAAIRVARMRAVELSGLEQLVAVGMQMHSVIDGAMEASKYASVLVEHTPAQNLALGVAIREIGEMIEIGTVSTSDRQAPLLRRAGQLAHKQQQALVYSERETISITFETKAVRARIREMKESLALAANLSSVQQSASNSSPGVCEELVAALAHAKKEFFQVRR